MSDLASLLIQIGLGVGLVGVAIAYVLLFPEKAQVIAGWIWTGIARVIHQADKKAVAYRVQGEINSARAGLIRDALDGIIEGRLKIDWNNAEQAEARARGGDVVVFMKRSRHRDEDVANALMAYLPKAVLPRARRYLDGKTMRAAISRSPKPSSQTTRAAMKRSISSTRSISTPRRRTTLRSVSG